MPADTRTFSSNSTSYSQRQVTQEQLRATQDELATKIRELQIYEANYVSLKKDVARWKKKFETIFHENELLSLETSKLDASHKQIAFLQQEIKFKEEESEALRGLVSALEASNKKARAHRLDASSSASASKATNKSSNPTVVADDLAALRTALAAEQAAHQADTDKLQNEIAALKNENAMLLKDLDRKDGALVLSEDKVAVHKQRIKSLEASLTATQNQHADQLREKQEIIEELETQLTALRARRRSSSAHSGMGSSPVAVPPPRPSPVRISEERESGATLSPRASAARSSTAMDSPDTPPGTPPPISAGYLLPDVDPTADQILRDWEDDRTVRAAKSRTFDLERLQAFLDKVPFEYREKASQILLDVVANPKYANSDVDGDADGGADGGAEDAELAQEAQVLIRHVPQDQQKELLEFVVPLLKAHRQVRVTYATLVRRTVVTDIRITLEPRDAAATGSFMERRFGKHHAFLGPSSEDPSKLVPHTVRTLTTQNKAAYVSKPLDEDSVGDSILGEDPRGRGESSAVPGRKWRMPVGQSLRHLNSMVAGAKQLVAAKFGQDEVDKFVHEGTSCQFCKVSPIVGPRYSCGTCVGFDLCGACYSLGGHGRENSDELFFRVQELVLQRCPRLTTEIDLMELMRYEICRSNLRKFSFCLNWLADIIVGKSSRDLQARALEIPSIRRDVRKQFVPLLMRLCSDRDDIEVKTEWELESDNAGAAAGSTGNGDDRFLETLRIWVADQYRTTSPFVERSLLKFREGASGELLEEDEDEGGADKTVDSDDPDARAGGFQRWRRDGFGGLSRPASGNSVDDKEREGTQSSGTGFLEKRYQSQAF